jgi:hypothetical protein
MNLRKYFNSRGYYEIKYFSQSLDAAIETIKAKWPN